MKKFVITIVVVVLAMATTFAQVPQAFKYQAIARDDAGNVLADRQVNLRISILQQTTDGPEVYSEIHPYQTNEFGLISLEVGKGEERSGSISDVDWSAGAHYLQIEMDISGGNNFKNGGLTHLLSVP